MVARLSAILSTLVLVCLVASCGRFGDERLESAPGSPTRSELESLLSRTAIVDNRPHPGGYERGCGNGEAPLTELNAEWCRSEGVGSMWVGSLRT